MLRNIDPLLSGDILSALDVLGHGDTLALVDRNFPSHRYGKPVLRLDGVDVPSAARAILSVFPLDTFAESPMERMEVDGEASLVTEVAASVERIASDAEGRAIVAAGVERQEFYRRASGASVFVQTGEAVGYSCFLLRKGVV